MIFRAFFGAPVEEALELEHGHLAHAEEPTNPQTARKRTPTSASPAPSTTSPRRDMPMKVAMAMLAVLAVIGGIVQIPGVDAGIERFLSPTFANSAVARVAALGGCDWAGLAIGAAVAIVGIATAYWVWYLKPRPTPANPAAPFARLYTLFVNKWYFDELIDRSWSGRCSCSGASESRCSSATS